MIETILSQKQNIIDVETCKICKELFPCTHKVRVTLEYKLTYEEIKILYKILNMDMEIHCDKK